MYYGELSYTCDQRSHLLSPKKFSRKRHLPGASLVVQRLRIRLPMQGTRVRSLVREDPSCRGALSPHAPTAAPAPWSAGAASRGKLHPCFHRRTLQGVPHPPPPPRLGNLSTVKETRGVTPATLTQGPGDRCHNCYQHASKSETREVGM